jgi:glycosyltransferase involved in cell wall biosynthesis
MISVCIPVYNYGAGPLVRELDRQAATLEEPIEILVYDDGSELEWKEQNRPLVDLNCVRYHELAENEGRGHIRNRMAREAGGQWLIFLDVDSRPGSDYLERYLQAKSPGVVVGGTRYGDRPPPDPALRLHWHYGRQRESIPPARRRPNDYCQFQSNNFLVPREVMLQHPFPDVAGYGHEDTLWGQLLEPTEVALRYIDNPVEHLGLETDGRFLEKQRTAVENLRQLKRLYPALRSRLTDIIGTYPRLSRLVAQLPKSPLRFALRHSYRLELLDLLKIGWYLNP